MPEHQSRGEFYDFNRCRSDLNHLPEETTLEKVNRNFYIVLLQMLTAGRSGLDILNGICDGGLLGSVWSLGPPCWPGERVRKKINKWREFAKWRRAPDKMPTEQFCFSSKNPHWGLALDHHGSGSASAAHQNRWWSVWSQTTSVSERAQCRNPFILNILSLSFTLLRSTMRDGHRHQRTPWQHWMAGTTPCQ